MRKPTLIVLSRTHRDCCAAAAYWAMPLFPIGRPVRAEGFRMVWLDRILQVQPDEIEIIGLYYEDYH